MGPRLGDGSGATDTLGHVEPHHGASGSSESSTPLRVSPRGKPRLSSLISSGLCHLLCPVEVPCVQLLLLVPFYLKLCLWGLNLPGDTLIFCKPGLGRSGIWEKLEQGAGKLRASASQHWVALELIAGHRGTPRDTEGHQGTLRDTKGHGVPTRSAGTCAFSPFQQGELRTPPFGPFSLFFSSRAPPASPNPRTLAGSGASAHGEGKPAPWVLFLFFFWHRVPNQHDPPARRRGRAARCYLRRPLEIHLREGRAAPASQ